MSRKVEPVPAFLDEVLGDFAEHSTRCVAGAEFLLEELEEHDPDLSDRCGLLANRYELYALRIPDCARLVLAVSFDTSGKRPWPCIVHGLVARTARSCEVGRVRAARHLTLIDPAWEPGNA